MPFAPFAWNAAVSKLRRKLCVLAAGNPWWTRCGEICSSLSACSAGIRVQLQLSSSRWRLALA